MSTEENHQRERFGSRTAFYFAAVGSAVGFGNVWRFPTLAYKYGGGAFFIPYLLALFLIGLPVLFLEIALGQFYQRGDVSVFAVCHRRMRGVGISSIACGFMTLTYYSMLIAWTTRSLFESGSTAAPWNIPNITSSDARDYFLNNLIGMETLSSENGLRPTRLVGLNVGCSFFVHFVIFMCIAFGLKTTGIITYVTMGLPIVMLFVFLIIGCLLEGSDVGIRAYIGEWDMSVLTNRGDVWSTAVSQIFFSIGVTFGIMTAYGSHMPRDEPAFVNSCVIAGSNSLFSIIAGFAVFAAIGSYADSLGVDVSQLEDISTFGLVFGTWPLVLSQLPGGIHLVHLLFIFLFLLGIDSAFSFEESLLTCLRDTVQLRAVKKWKIAVIIGIMAWLLSFIYATDIDFYINFVMLIVGFFESFAIGWIYGIEDQIAKFGKLVVFMYMLGNFGAISIASVLWFGLNSVWGGFVALILFYAVFISVTVLILMKNRNEQSSQDTLCSSIYDLAFGNILSFKAKAEPTIQIVPRIWCYTIKQFVPHILLILFINLAQTKVIDEDGIELLKFGNYEFYVFFPYQLLGIMTFVFAAVLFVGAILFPQAFAILDTHEEDDVSTQKSSFAGEDMNESMNINV